MFRVTYCALITLVVLAGIASYTAADEAGSKSVIRVGIVQSLLGEMPEPMVEMSRKTFRMLVESQTGLRAELVPMPGSSQLGKELAAGKVHLGVFNGIEFGWAREEHAKLTPLVIVINELRELHAHVLVAKSCDINEFEDLRGKSIALPRGGMDHCQVFLDRRSRALGAEQISTFADLVTPPNAEDGIDDVVDGDVDAVVVDGLALRSYERRKPGRFARLREIAKSGTFPAAVIAYQPGLLPEATLQNFKEGMIKSNQTATGRRLLNLWKISAFENVPENYGQLVLNITHTYPRRAAVAGTEPPATAKARR